MLFRREPEPGKPYAAPEGGQRLRSDVEGDRACRELRLTLLSELSQSDFRSVVRRMIDSAKAGDTFAGATLVNFMAQSAGGVSPEEQAEEPEAPAPAEPAASEHHTARRATDLTPETAQPKKKSVPFWEGGAEAPASA